MKSTIDTTLKQSKPLKLFCHSIIHQIRLKCLLLLPIHVLEYSMDQKSPINSEVCPSIFGSIAQVISSSHQTILICNLTGFQNTSSQIASSFSPDGNYIISASEDSQVYIWKREESRNAGHRKNKNIVSIPSHEHFQCRDVSVAIPWPGSSKNEVPIVEVHSRKHSKRINQHSQPGTDSPPKERAGTNSKRQLPPLPKQNNQLERVPSCSEKDLDQISCDESGRGDSFDSASTASTSSRYDPSSISSTSRHSGSWSWFDVGHCHGHTMEATAWGLVIVTAGLGGEIRAYQNFGLPVKVSRHSKLFRDLT